MGAVLSLTAEEVADWLSHDLGKNGTYAVYATAVLDNAVDGELLADLTEEEFAETLLDLHVVNRLHTRVLTKEWRLWKRQAANVVQEQAEDDEYPSASFTLPVSNRLTTEEDEPKPLEVAPVTCTPSVSPLDDTDNETTSSTAPVEEVQTDDLVLPSSQAPRGFDWTRQHMVRVPTNLPSLPRVEPTKLGSIMQAVQQYDITEDTDARDLEDFDTLVQAAGEATGAMYAGMHLFDVDGHLAVSCRMALQGNDDDDDKPEKASPTFATNRLHVPKEASQCYRSLLEEESDIILRRGTHELLMLKPPSSGNADKEEKSADNDTMPPPMTYVGMVTRNRSGERVGMLCVIMDETQAAAFDSEKQDILQELAAMAQDQLETRRILVERNRNLRGQIKALQVPNDEENLKGLIPPRIFPQQVPNEEGGGTGNSSVTSDSSITLDSILSPGMGPVPSVTRGDLLRRPKSFFPTLVEWEESGQPLIPTAKLPYDPEFMANDSERAHLPDDFHAINDEMGVAYPPIHKNDMERVALIKTLGLKDMKPDDPTALALKRIARLAASLFDVDNVSFSVMEHDKDYNLVNFSTEDVNPFLQFRDTITKDVDGKGAWVVCNPRGFAFCNFVVYTGETMTAQDCSKDPSLEWMPKAGGFKFFSSSPVRYGGHIVATLCLADFQKVHPEFGPAQQIQQEQLAQMASEHISNWVLRQEMERLENDRRRANRRFSMLTRRRSTMNMTMGDLDNASVVSGLSLTSNRTSFLERVSRPEETCAIVFTDVQGSTALWEANPSVMQDALRLHDQIIRQNIAEHSGYEISTEGDAFHIAFHDSVDAVSFALAVQTELYEAQWSSELLELPDANVQEHRCLRGLRVRMAIHYGPVETRQNNVTSQREYIGATVNIAKSLEHMCHGGQILVTSDVWSEASHLAVSELGSPQVLDLGSHILLPGKKKGEGVVGKGVIQLVPSQLAYDYSQKASSSSAGRQFPSVLTIKQVSASFHDAPCIDGQATLVFIYASQIEAHFSSASMVLSALAKQIGSMLAGRNGYQCKNLMLTFPNESEGVTFGLDLQEYLATNLILGANLNGMVKVGVHHGEITSMIPSPQTGRADYFGKVVNRAARVAGATKAGEVWLGTQSYKENSPPNLQMDLEASYVGLRSLKGVQEEMALYACSRAGTQ